MARDRLKQRLTGAVALIAIGVVAWFWLLNSDEGVVPVAQETMIPPAPEIERFPVEEPGAPDGMADTPAPSFEPGGVEQPVTTELPSLSVTGDSLPASEPAVPSAPAPEPSAPAPEPSAPAAQPAAENSAAADSDTSPGAAVDAPVGQRFAVDDDGAPEAWVVQVASLSSDANAARLVEQLQRAGFKAYRRTVQAGGKPIQRVFAGPWLSREQAATQQKVIAERFKVKPIVVSFEP